MEGYVLYIFLRIHLSFRRTVLNTEASCETPCRRFFALIAFSICNELQNDANHLQLHTQKLFALLIGEFVLRVWWIKTECVGMI